MRASVSTVSEQARRRVDDRGQELVLRAQLRLQPLVVERECRRGGDALDELGLGRERLVVQERADPAARRARRP